MIQGTTLKSCNASLKNGIVKISLSFIVPDAAEFARLEALKDNNSVVNIDIREVPVNRA